MRDCIVSSSFSSGGGDSDSVDKARWEGGRGGGGGGGDGDGSGPDLLVCFELLSQRKASLSRSISLLDIPLPGGIFSGGASSGPKRACMAGIASGTGSDGGAEGV